MKNLYTKLSHTDKSKLTASSIFWKIENIEESVPSYVLKYRNVTRYKTNQSIVHHLHKPVIKDY